MTDDYEYFMNKRTDRVYLSRSLVNRGFEPTGDGEVREIERPFRIISKIVEESEGHQFIKNGKEVSLRVTDGERQEIKAKFYEDSRSVFTLQIQKYTMKSGAPHNQYFTFVGAEILVLFNFLRNIAVLPLQTPESRRLDDSFIEELVLSKEQALQLLQEQPDLMEELIRTQITKEDVINLAHRREQLKKYRSLLDDPVYFESCRDLLGTNKGPEDVWQHYFEENPWIFGYGLNYVFNTSLDGEKLEQVVRGADFSRGGKRVDVLLKTRGLVSSLAFGEIKTHDAKLLANVKTAYRGESWVASKEVTGGIAQVHRSVQQSIENLRTKTEIKYQDGGLTGEQLFLYQPKSFLVIGSLAEFQTDNGINEEKYSSFELFRKNLQDPEIITYDELYERARFIVESHGGSETA
jgi:hypothetical protein